jgi:hypothetical protein
MIFTLAARESARSNGCGRVPKKGWTILLYTVAYNIIMIIIIIYLTANGLLPGGSG